MKKHSAGLPKKIRAIDYLFVAALLASLTACASAPSSRTSSSRDTPDYCRIVRAAADDKMPKRWLIRKLDINNLVSKESYNFSFATSALRFVDTPKITITTDDKLRIQRVDDQLLLTITKGDSGVLEASGVVELNGWFTHRWAEGKAYDKYSSHVGSFYLYLLVDTKVCRHPYSDTGSSNEKLPCRAVHLEYFEKNHPYGDHLPKWQKNVLPISDKICTDPRFVQTGEGDADEGRNAN